MEAKDRKKRNWPVWAGTALALLVLYVASIGPVGGLLRYFKASNETVSIAEQFYEPIALMEEACPSIQPPLEWYISCFVGPP